MPTYGYYGVYNGTSYSGDNTIHPGEVLVFALNTDGSANLINTITSDDVSANDADRFGASISKIPDMDMNNMIELAVGAPSTDDG